MMTRNNDTQPATGQRKLRSGDVNGFAFAALALVATLTMGMVTETTLSAKVQAAAVAEAKAYAAQAYCQHVPHPDRMVGRTDGGRS